MHHLESPHTIQMSAILKTALLGLKEMLHGSHLHGKSYRTQFNPLNARGTPHHLSTVKQQGLSRPSGA
jgi:hypothetical protein